MKTFLIKAPATGKTTCTLARQYYDKESRRTRTEYLGSFNRAADSAQLPAGIRLRPGVQLLAQHLEEVREWLKRHGTHGAPPVFSQELLDRAREQIALEQRCPPQSDLDLAAGVLSQAALEIKRRAAQLRTQGLELSKGFLGYTGTDAQQCLNELDRLKVKTNLIRFAAIAFEEALKDAKLMKRVNKISRAPAQAPG